MVILILSLFITGYFFITIEHKIHVNKAAVALLTGVLCWTVYMLSSGNNDQVIGQLSHHLGEISQILFFLIGAMTIVELIDAHDGFEIIKNMVQAKTKTKLLWMISILTFFLSAILDNLTTTIVMITLLRKILEDKEDRLLFSGMIIIAANAGGAWSPIGDVTTTMLWIGGKITSMNIIKELILPSLVCMVIPALMIGRKVKGVLQVKNQSASGSRQGIIILSLGVAVLCFIPVFKSWTHLPPYMGMLLGLGFMWIITELLHKRKTHEEKHKYTVSSALQKIDIPSILFFLGILLTVASLESTGMLHHAAEYFIAAVPHYQVLTLLIGLFSAVVDNIPLVAGTMGMFDMNIYPTDHHFWEMLAYTAGTGGSALIIGSAAGVAAMGMENISFTWYLKRITLVALIGYLAGAVFFMLQNLLL